MSFGAGGFTYRRKLDDVPSPVPHSPADGDGQIPTASVAALAQMSPDDALRDVEARTSRINLFTVYLCVAGALLLFALGSAVAFIALFTVFGVGAVFVFRWDRDRRTARILYDIDNDEIVVRLAICNAVGEALARTAALWHVYSSVAAGDRKYHGGAGTLIQRTVTHSGPGSFPGIDLNIEPWAIAIGPQQLLFLPDRLLVREGKRYAAVPYEWLSAVHETTRFVEDGPVPTDSQLVDMTWRFVNKSGGPDRRFNDNRQIPVLVYGELTLRSGNGIQVVLQASNPAATQHAAFALQELARAQIAQPVASAPSYSASPSQQMSAPAYVPAPTIQPARSPQPRPAPARLPAPMLVQDTTPAHPPTTRPTDSPRPPPARALSGGGTVAMPQYVAPPPTRAEPKRHGFYGADETLTVANRILGRPLTYAAPTKKGIEASTIVTSLRVGNAAHARSLSYWPSYADADPDQRARYLDWMAGGRVDPEIEIGYVFIFFYGLEWRVLREGADVDLACAEVRRLFDIYASQSGSFRSYTSSFLAFVAAGKLETMDEQELEREIGWLVDERPLAAAGLLAWYVERGRPLPARHAARVASSMEHAKRGVVVKRAAEELAHLFEVRYRERFGDGMMLRAAKRRARFDYNPASSTLLHSQIHLEVSLPDVLGRKGQFVPLVSIWNECVDDLRKASTLKGKSAGALTAEAWAALPAELRAQYEHPDRDRWDAVIAQAPRIDAYHMLTVSRLAPLIGLDVGDDPTAKVSAVRLRRIVETAADLGYAIEPDARLHRKAGRARDEMLVWSVRDTSAPDQKVYGSLYTLLALAMNVALADGVLLEEETRVVTSMLSHLFALDDGLRGRVVALQHLLARSPARATTVAKKLRSTRTPEELAKIGRVLVAVAAVDGEVAEVEHDALRSLYTSLGLSGADLAAAVAGSGARLASDNAVEMKPASAGRMGEVIPCPPDAQARVELDHEAIAAILADTREVAAMLADVLDQDEDEPPSAHAPSPSPVSAPDVSPEILAIAGSLDIRYHAVLEELLTKTHWSSDDVRALGKRRSLMPGAILETINSWSDEALGDFLIDEQEHWHVRAELVRKENA